MGGPTQILQMSLKNEYLGTLVVIIKGACGFERTYSIDETDSVNAAARESRE